MSEKTVSEQDALKITTFEQWVHEHVDKSIEFCNDCPINPNYCNIACPYRDALFVHLSDLKKWLQQKRKFNPKYNLIANEIKRKIIDEFLEDLDK